MGKVDEINQALRAGKITKRQNTAMLRHSEREGSPHIRHMISNMSHMRFAEAHKAARAPKGPKKGSESPRKKNAEATPEETDDQFAAPDEFPEA